MSKLDAQRAMREANYAARQGAKPTSRATPDSGEGPAPATTGKKPRRPAAPTPKRADAVETEAASTSCGHKSMNGRACTREAGHSEKSHRYS